MRFENPNLLFLLFAALGLAVFYIFGFSAKKKALLKFGEPHLIEKLSNADLRSQAIKAILTVISITFIVTALARPQIGTRMVERKSKGVDVVLAVDVSRSMLAEDIKPSRLQSSKAMLSDIIRRLEGNRIGVIAFAGTAFWQCPLTLDISGARLFLQILNENLIPLPGTAIGQAIRTAVKGLERQQGKSKILVLLTDGEDHKSDPVGAAKEAEKKGVKIYTIGVGSKKGEPIPQRDYEGKFLGYIKDKNGEVVMSKMDESTLIKIAQITGGKYIDASSGNIDSASIAKSMEGFEKTDFKAQLTREYEDRYQYLLIIAILLLLIELIYPQTKKRANR